MSNKILVEFDRKKLQEKCKILQQYPNNWCYDGCKKKDEDLVDCVIRQSLCHEYKIKEQ